MSKTIKELAEIANEELDRTAVLMYRQIKSGELDKTIADKAIGSAQRAAKRVHNLYFSRKHHLTTTACNEHLRQLTEFSRSELYENYNFLNDRFNKVLKHYAKAVGAGFQDKNKDKTGE